MNDQERHQAELEAERWARAMAALWEAYPHVSADAMRTLLFECGITERDMQKAAR